MDEILYLISAYTDVGLSQTKGICTSYCILVPIFDDIYLTLTYYYDTKKIGYGFELREQ